MSRLIITAACFALSILSGCAQSTAPKSLGLNGTNSAKSTEADSDYRLPKQIRYSFTLSNSTGKLLKNPQFWTYLPVPQTAFQKVKKIIANYPYREEHDDLGNSKIHFDLKDIPPYGAVIISITVDMLMSDRPVAMPVGDRVRFLAQEPYIESDDNRIIALATKLKRGSAKITADNDYEWVAQNILSENYIAEDRGAVYAIEARKGDCTEFSYLLTALYRAQKIPARAIGGYVFGGNGVVKAMDYHNWTEFYLDGAWQIADAQKGNFLNKQTDYVAMRTIATGREAAFASQRFSYAGEGLQVEMN